MPAWITNVTRGEATPTATYFDNTGTLQVASVNAPRFGYDLWAKTPLGYISERADTNAIRNNTMVGVSPGTPGTPPTNWSVPASTNGLSTQIAASGTDHGMAELDFRVFGTATNTNPTQIYFEATNVIATTTNQHRNVQAYLSLQAGSNTNVTNISLDLDQRDSTNTALGIVSGLNIYSNLIPSQLSLFWNNLATPAATVAFSSPLLTITPAVGAVDITVRIAIPQLTGLLTSPILTSGSAVTRNHDSAQFNAAVAAILATKVCSVAGIIDGGTSAASAPNSAFVNATGGNVGIGFISPNSVGSTFSLTTALSSTLNFNIGIAESLLTRTLTNNGGALYDAAVVSDAGPVSLGPYLGTDSSGNYALNNAVATINIWPSTLTAPQLQTATKPINPTTSWGDSITAGTGSVTPNINFGFVGWLTRLLGSKAFVYGNGYPGQGSTYIKNQMLADTKHINDTTIIEIGRNDAAVSQGNIPTVVANAQAMVAHLAPGNTRYVVLSVVNQTSENSAATGNSLAFYNWIIALNAAFAAAFPNNYLDVRSAVVAASGGANDAPAASYMYQSSVHGNDASYQVWATQIKAFGHAAGWPGY
jgi:lysophospholipase L1-like esterase